MDPNPTTTLDDTFETGIKLMRDAYSQAVTAKDAEILRLRTELARQDSKLEEWQKKTARLMDDVQKANQLNAQLQAEVERLKHFRKNILESFDDEDIVELRKKGAGPSEFFVRRRKQRDDAGPKVANDVAFGAAASHGFGGFGGATTSSTAAPAAGLGFGGAATSAATTRTAAGGVPFDDLNTDSEDDSDLFLSRRFRTMGETGAGVGDLGASYGAGFGMNGGGGSSGAAVASSGSFDKYDALFTDSLSEDSEFDMNAAAYTKPTAKSRSASAPAPTSSAAAATAATTTTTGASTRPPGSGAEPAVIDGKEFFKKARARLPHEQFQQVLTQVQKYNNRQQSKKELLDNLSGVLYGEYHDLYDNFKKLFAAPSS